MNKMIKRNVRTPVAVLFLCLLSVQFALAAEPLLELSDLISSNKVTLGRTTGNGGSSGMAIEAVLKNKTAQELKIAVLMSAPLYLKNGNSGAQNMVALQVYEDDGGYYQTSDKQMFLVLPSNATKKVAFLAFCTDFEKDNPGEADSFSLGTVPANIRDVLKKIHAYAQNNPDSDLVAAAQVAIWRTQGVSLSDIREKFDVDSSAERLAKEFMTK